MKSKESKKVWVYTVCCAGKESFVYADTIEFNFQQKEILLFLQSRLVGVFYNYDYLIVARDAAESEYRHLL